MTEPRFRPRPGGLRMLGIVQIVFLVLLGLAVVAGQVWSREAALLDRLLTLLPLIGLGFLLLVALSIGAQLHAYLGAPRGFGIVPTPLQMWRNKALSQLPRLPSLPRWKVALCYGVPLLVAGALALFVSRDLGGNSARMNARFNTRSMQSSAFGLGFIRVSCGAFLIPGKTAESLCFVLPGARNTIRKNLSFPQALTEWTFQEGKWVEMGRRFEDTRVHEPGRVTLALREGGGVAGGSQVVTLRVYGSRLASDQVPRPFRLDYLTRTSGKEGAVPPDLARQAVWLWDQPFHAYFVVTPVR